ncbi:putative endoglucanase, partial [Microthyrium microscopicum]
MSFTQTISILSLLASLASCHMEMSWPIPMDSKLNPAATNPDYNLMAPLAADGSQFPCKGYQKQNWPSSTTLQAGDTDPYNITLVDSAFHNGGSCQISLSIDQDHQVFRVIKSFIGGCPSGPGPIDLDYTIPDYVPSGPAILAWTWMNHNGNREFYMNCAAVTISSSTTDDADFNSKLPGIWVANQISVNHCATNETYDPVFPDPGPSV